jgi:hypothetical protein
VDAFIPEAVSVLFKVYQSCGQARWWMKRSNTLACLSKILWLGCKTTGNVVGGHYCVRKVPFFEEGLRQIACTSNQKNSRVRIIPGKIAIAMTAILVNQRSRDKRALTMIPLFVLIPLSSASSARSDGLETGSW